MKHAKEEQLNNEGFSLVELLIAIVILSIIVVPLLHSFVTSARTNAKSRNTMHATAIAEDVMEQFEAHTLGEMADTYEAASVEGFTNTVKRGEDIDSDGDLEWVYTFRDSSTTSGAYDLVTTLDPSAYTTINEKDLIDIQNLAGNLNAVYSEKADSDIGAYLYFSNYATNTALENIPKYVKKIVEITIDTNRIGLDLGDGETLETDVYLVTALTRYHCDTSIFNNPSLSGDYPQNGTDYVIFSNEDTVRRQAAQIKAQKEAGAAVQSKVISDLANIVVCLPTRMGSISGSEVRDTVIVNNPDNVETNLYLVMQLPTTDELPAGVTNAETAYRDMINNTYRVAYELRESYPGWMSSAGASIQSACKLRTNLILNGYTDYKFRNLSVSEAAGTATGADAKSIMSASGLTPPSEKIDRMYDITVQVYAQGTIGTKNPVITMTGTVTQ